MTTHDDLTKPRWVFLSEASPVAGSVMRWRDNTRHPWEYGIYTGVKNGAMTFSMTPGGVPFVWTISLPRYVQTIIIEGRGES